MPVSCNSIFHYTGKLNNLKKIIVDKAFKVSYCSEKITVERDGETSYFGIAIPMVSFCDIPLTDVESHTKKYGFYGLGLSKQWAIKNGLNPILYLEKRSNITESVSSFDYLIGRLISYPELIDIDSDAFNNTVKSLQQALNRSLGFMKNYSDDLNRKKENRIIKNYNFYEEREWRYVPNTIGNNRLMLLDDEYEKNRESFNLIANKERLKFEYSDVSYIILRENSKIDSFVKYINKYVKDDKDLLCSKIITLEQISKDF